MIHTTYFVRNIYKPVLVYTDIICGIGMTSDPNNTVTSHCRIEALAFRATPAP